MNLSDYLQLIRALERQEQIRRPAANWIAWISVAVAAIILLVMITTASQRLAHIQTQAAAKNRDLQVVQRKLTEAEDSLRGIEEIRHRKEQEVRGLQAVIDTLPPSQRRALIDKTLDKTPDTAKLLPRVYLHILAEDDRPYAETIAARLRDEGYLVVGIRRVRLSTRLQSSDVRFYRKAEQAEAERILAVLKSAGEKNARTNHLAEYENSTTARPNHFEVWLAGRQEPAPVIGRIDLQKP